MKGMTFQRFWEIANGLARKAFVLERTAKGKSPDAFWHGLEKEPIISVFLDRVGQWMQLSIDQEDSGAVVCSDRPISSKIPLNKRYYVSLPSVDAIFLV